MKYKISTIILSIILIIIVAFSTVNAYASNNVQVGDANGDGDINLLDVACLAQYVAGWDVELGGNSSSVSSRPSAASSNTSVEYVSSNPSVESSYASSSPSEDSNTNTSSMENSNIVSSQYPNINTSSSMNNVSSSYSESSNDGWSNDYIIK